MANDDCGPRSPVRVLLAEDDAIVAKLTRRSLERQGMLVQHVTTGPAVLEAVRAGHFDLLLLDLGLPELDGLTVARRLRAERARSSFFLIALTAADCAEVDWRAAGVDAVLEKPLDIAALARLLG